MDFNNIKEKVDKERQRRVTEGVARGEKVTNHAPKDSLLHGLVNSLQTGQPSELAENIKQVNRLASTKSGNPAVPKMGGGGLSSALTQHIGTPPQQAAPPIPPPQIPRQQHVDDRERLFEQQLQQRPLQVQASLSEQLAGWGSPQQPQQQYYPPQVMQQPTPPQNPSLINEQINAAIGQIDFSSMLQESMKSTVMEMYSNEKIQHFIMENKEMIKKIVMETIIELSKAKGKKT